MSHGKKRKRDESKQTGNPLCNSAVESKSESVDVVMKQCSSSSLPSLLVLCGRKLTNGRVCQQPVIHAQTDLRTESSFCKACRGDLGTGIAFCNGTTSPYSSCADIIYRVMDKDGHDVPLDDDTELVFLDDEDNDEDTKGSSNNKSAAAAAVQQLQDLAERLQLPLAVTQAAQAMWREIRSKLDRIVDPLALRALIIKLCSYRQGCPVPLDRLYSTTGVDASALVHQRAKLNSLGVDVSFDRALVVNGLIAHYLQGWVRSEIDKNTREPGPFTDAEIRRHASDILLPQAKKLVAAYFSDEKSQQQKSQCSTLAASMLLVLFFLGTLF
jgi:hypothetical protein